MEELRYVAAPPLAVATSRVTGTAPAHLSRVAYANKAKMAMGEQRYNLTRFQIYRCWRSKEKDEARGSSCAGRVPPSSMA